MKFSFDTIQNFDKHISDSIYGYNLLDDLIMNVCSFYAKDGETVVDLGCTSGRLVDKLSTTYPKVRCIGYDITDHNFLKDTKAELIKQDITKSDFVIPQANIIFTVFTLQFLRNSDRVNVLNKIYSSLNKNGVLIICEKELSSVGIFQEVFTFSNFIYKKDNFSAAEILQKEYNLRSIMNCLSTGENKKMLQMAGFRNVEQFFQSLNFKGWLCMK